MPSAGWQFKQLSATRSRAIVFYILTVVLSSRLDHLFANPRAGSRCADRARQALTFAQLRSRMTHSIAYAGGYLPSPRR